ncbi:MAG: phenylacetate--CoA ligase family protein [Planctomycetota bacterium]|jgi:phenylacetate-CoA ligase|nr:MAG: phenylacetate--CoA ligase family protein [Planctomycetaceae bacterium]
MPSALFSTREALDRLKLNRLNSLLATILPHNDLYRRKLAGFISPLESFDAMEQWPFTTKSELVDGAISGSPLNLTWPVERYTRFHQTSGTRGRPLPIFDTPNDWQWWIDCWKIILDRVGVSSTDRAMVASSFGPFIGFWSAFESIIASGVMAIPTGGLSSEARIDIMQRFSITVLVGTPSYLLHLATVATTMGISTRLLPVRLVIVAGEPGGSILSVRKRLADSWDAIVIDHAGASEIGPWGIGAADGGYLEVLEEWFHPEFLSIESGKAAREGELSELVISTLGRDGCPVLRYRTGDVVRPQWISSNSIAAGESPRVRLVGGILGRVDSMMVVRGVNIFPSSIDEIVRRFPEIGEYQLTIRRKGELDEIEIDVEDSLEQLDRIRQALESSLGLRVIVRQAPSGSLPRTVGKAQRIFDRRPHQA